MHDTDTIVAQATAPGRAGIGIIRVSGPSVVKIAKAILKKLPAPRYASYQQFFDHTGSIIDQGIAIYFPAPNSFTGEDVLELHGHGGPIVLDILLQTILNIGARLAHPGEFSERAFLNNKLDLAQAEAIADLINASSGQAARSAMRSLQGEFSKHVNKLVEGLIKLRIYVEAAIDFPEEEIDFLADGKITEELVKILNDLLKLKSNTKQGILLQEGINIVIGGKPNVGKSSLLNALSGRETAIVTNIPGTTRDILRENIQIDGLPLHIIDTAGLRDSHDIVEQEGIRRAYNEITKADNILLVTDASQTATTHPYELWPDFKDKIPLDRITVIRNKIDLTDETANIIAKEDYTIINLSTKNQLGLNLLTQHLKKLAGFNTSEDTFIARRRHLTALEKAKEHLLIGQKQLTNFRAGELLAEELKQAQLALSEITGEFTADDLLARIFASFCIGK